MLHNARLQQWTTHTNPVFPPPPLNALSHMGWRQEYCREWAPHCQTPLSVFLSSHSAALQCFSAHAQTDWATASLSSLEILTAWIADTSTLHAASLRCGNKSLVWRNWKFIPRLQFERLKCIDEDTFAVTRVEPVTFFFTGLSFVSRSLCLPQAFYTNCSIQSEHSGCSFTTSYCLCLVNIHHLPLQSLLQCFSWALYLTIYI